MDVRIALCFSGKVRRNWSETCPGLKKYVAEKLQTLGQVDCFLATWADDEAEYLNNREIVRFWDCKLAEQEFHHLAHINLYEKLGGNVPPWAPRPFMWSMFHSMYKANHLKRMYEIMTGRRYDVVFRLRSDLDSNDKLLDLADVHKVLEDRNPNAITTWFQEMPEMPPGGMKDVWAFGMSEAMDVFSEMFLHMPHIFAHVGPKFANAGRPIYPEAMLSEYVIHYRRMKVTYVPCNTVLNKNRHV